MNSYHQINIFDEQQKIKKREQAELNDLLSIPIDKEPNWSEVAEDKDLRQAISNTMMDETLWKAFLEENGLGVGVGSIIMTLNAVFLTSFTLGCNSLRHLVGGNVNCYSCASFGNQRYQTWKFVSLFNAHHNLWAWISLFWVGFTDLYIRFVSMSIITDYRIL